MKSTVKLKYLRIAPRKVRLVADVIKGKRVSEAHGILDAMVKKAAHPMTKSLRAAVASAQNNFQADEANLYIEKVAVEEGPKLKRYRPRARGRAYPIHKKTSHITLVLSEMTPGGAQPAENTKTSHVPETNDIPTREEARLETRQRFRPEREIAKPKTEGRIKRIFRRKAV